MTTAQATKGPGWLRRALDVFVPTTLFGFARPVHGCRLEGANTVPPCGPAVVIANHPCHADAAFLMAACGRWIHFLQAREEYNVRLLRPFFRLFGCIPVSRDRADVGAVRAALDELKRGAVLGVFPEGDITPSNGTLRRGKAGAALLALRSRVPVIPAFISGTAPSRGSVVDWLRPAPGVRVRFGPPVDLAAYADQPITHALLQEVTEVLMQRIAELRIAELRIAELRPSTVHSVVSEPRA